MFIVELCLEVTQNTQEKHSNGEKIALLVVVLAVYYSVSDLVVKELYVLSERKLCGGR